MKLMLAATVKDIESLTYPLIASPKLDGIRCVILNGVAYSRAMKPIPNRFVQKVLGAKSMIRLFDGLDGELIVGRPTAKNVFNQTTSAVMSQGGEPNFRFFVFDHVHHAESSYSKRQLAMKMAADRSGVIQLAQQIQINDQESLLQYEHRCLTAGYEGVVLRKPHAPYKHGRSTLKEGTLMKLKRFKDSEAIVIGMTELMHNGNEATINELGYKERSSKKANKIGLDTMGSLIVRDLKTKVEFEIGTGFTDADRAWWWNRGSHPHRLIIKYKYQPTGVKDKPRFPVYLGIRDRRDL